MIGLHWDRLLNSTALRWIIIVTLISTAFGCVSRQPTIAHIHVGHAITGAHDTQDRVGYFVLAQSLAEDAVSASRLATQPSSSLEQVKLAGAKVHEITNTREPYALTSAVREAADHIEFAAKSVDASNNIVDGYLDFKASIEGVLFRGGLIASFAQQLQAVETLEEAQFIAEQIQSLAQANISGVDSDSDGLIGSTPSEYGIVQIKRALDELVAREDPPYLTVSRWYLFNLIRLPSGDWVFKRSGGGGSRGY